MASMKAANRLKVAFDEGKGPSMGCWQMIPGANVSRTLARTGVDWVLVDCEVCFRFLNIYSKSNTAASMEIWMMPQCMRQFQQSQRVE